MAVWVFCVIMAKRRFGYNMGKSTKDLKEIIPDFQKFLVDRSLAQEKNIPFLAYWVSRYLAFCHKRDLSIEDYTESAVAEFIDMLRAGEKTLDWQPRQADDAIKLYYFNFLGKSKAQLTNALKTDVTQDALNEVVRLIRLRRYSSSTESTYIHWINRFISHVCRTFIQNQRSFRICLKSL